MSRLPVEAGPRFSVSEDIAEGECMLLRTVQILIATLLTAGAIIGSLWVLGVIDPTEAKTTMSQIGGVIGICLIVAIAMIGLFNIGGSHSEN